MSSDDYQIQDVYRYSRKSYKKNRRATPENNSGSPREDVNIELSDTSPQCNVRSNGFTIDSSRPGCSCELDPEGDIASILHKKCPVISLAQQQLQRLLEGTDSLLCDNTRCCRSIYDFICICKELILNQNKCQCILLLLAALAFFMGILFGAASCGTQLGQFNSPILSCLDSLFIPDTYPTVEQTFRSIV